MPEYSRSRRSVSAPSASPAARRHQKSLRLRLALIAPFFVPLASLVAQTPTPVQVPTWRYDLTHAGQNTSETALTPANVNVNTFGKLFSLAVDGQVMAQPLYMPGLTMGDGLVHNVVFIATLHDSVFAFDADTNGGANANPIWQISLLSAAHGAAKGATAPGFALLGTPAINPQTNTMYVVALTEESGVYITRLHAISIITGVEQPNSPVAIEATVPGTGTGSSGGQLSFSPLWQIQRPALNYYNGYVYIAFGSNGDIGPWHGWVFAYDAESLARTGVMCLTPHSYGAGVWEAGAGMPIDDDAPGGRMFVVTGNGAFSQPGFYGYPPFNENTEYGESIIDINLANGGLTATDVFSSFNGVALSLSDADQGSGGILMVPDQQGTYPHIMVQAGKEGRILVLNRDSLGGWAGKTATSNTNILQDIPGQIGGLWSTPAYWNGNVYIWGSKDVPKMFTLSDGVLATTPSSQSTISSLFPGASFVVSSNGAQDGVAWAARTDQFVTNGPAILYAWDATDLANELYESDTNAARDSAGPADKFTVPVVTNGKVYVGAFRLVSVYGLFSQAQFAAAPVISPGSGNVLTGQTVQLSTATPNAAIYYTLDGSVPTPASTRYTGPITITLDTTVNALASATGYIQSPVSTATFMVADQTPQVTILPAAGTYTSAQAVTLSDTDTHASIYYTTDGSTPTASSKLYPSSPITVSASETINAIAIDPSLVNSNVTTASYVIQQSGKSINFSNGFSSTQGLTLNGSAVNTDDTRLQLTDGLLDQAGSAFWNQRIGIQKFTTTFSFQLSNGDADGITFTIQNIGPTALGKDRAGLGYAGIKKSVAIKFDIYNNAGEGDDSTGVYKDGAEPTVPALNMTKSGVKLRGGDTILVTVTYNGKTLKMNLLDLVKSKKFTFSKEINIPEIVGTKTAYVGFTGSSGSLAASQKLLSWTYQAQ